MTDEDPEADVPSLRKKEKRRESKGAGIVFGQGGVAGVGADLVPGPLAQAGKALLGLGSATGAVQPAALKTVTSLLAAKLLPAIATVLLTSATVGLLYQTFKPNRSKAPKAPKEFRSGPMHIEGSEIVEGGGSNDSLSYLIAGNQSSDPNKDSTSLNQSLMEQAALLPAPEEAEPKPASVQPKPGQEAPVPDEKKAPDDAAVAAAKAAAAAGPGISLASGIGLWKGITRKFDPKTELDLGRARILAGTAGAFKEQQSLYHGRGSKNSSSSSKQTAAMNQLFSAHQKSRTALGQSSAEGKAAGTTQAFGATPKAQSGPVRSSAKRGSGTDNVPTTFAMNDGGPINTPFTGKAPAPRLGETADQSPWTPDIERARDKLKDASSLVTVIGILAPFKMMPIIGPIVMMVQAILYSMALSYSSTANDIGTSIQSDYAQPQQSDIVTTGSAITDAAAAAAMAAPVSMTAWASVLAGVAGIAALIGVLLATKM